MSKQAIQFFLDKYGLTVGQIDQLIATALARGGDYADLFFEYRVAHSVGAEEQIVKSATQSVVQGVGVRVIVGEKTGYAYTDEIEFGAIRGAAETASHIARTGLTTQSVGLDATPTGRSLYPVDTLLSDVDLAKKIDLITRGDRIARAYDPRIREVQASVHDEIKYVMVATSEGRLAGDIQPMARIAMVCIADDDANRRVGGAGGGDRVVFEFYEDHLPPNKAETEAARQAIIQLEAIDAPAGKMEVVLGPGWPGILLHEAVGHGLESDFNRKKTSAFS